MICGECGKTVPADADFCPFCATEVERDTQPQALMPPPPPPPLAPPAPPPAPTYAAPVGPPAPPPAPGPRSSGPGIVIGAVAAVVMVLVILGGVAAYLALNRHQPAKTQASTAATQQPADTAPAPAPVAAGGDASGGAAQSLIPGAGGLNLDDFVGTWQFVGEPGPWGEGWPFKLRCVENLIIGDVEVPELYDGTSISLKMAVGNGELTGESTEVDNGGSPENHAVLMTLSDSKTVMTLKYRGGNGEWFTHVAEKKSGASGG